MSANALIQSALQALQAGHAASAIHLLSSAAPALRRLQSVQRTLAAAHAHSGDLVAAQRAITLALAHPVTTIEPATRALAGRIALDLGARDAAFSQFQLLVVQAPKQPAFWRYLWQSAHDTRTRARALALSIAHAGELHSPLSTAWAASQAMIEAGRVQDAVVLAERALSAHSTQPNAQWLYINRLLRLKPLTALQAIQKAPFSLSEVASADAVDAALQLPELYPDRATIRAWRDRYRAGLTRAARDLATASLDDTARLDCIRHTAFLLAYHGENDLTLQSRRGDWLCALAAPTTPTKAPPTTEMPQDRLRVGFVSKHIRDCTVGHYFKRFMTDLSDSRLEVFIYACGERDAFTDAVIAHADHHQFFAGDPSAATLEAASARIRDDRLDVLIYPEIGMEPLIEKLAAMRLAPLQAALWGHPVTTGLPTVDVFFSGAALEPHGAALHYRERLQLLPRLGTCYPAPPPPSALTRTQLGLPDGVPLLVCAQSAFKWSPEFTRAVTRCMSATPSARLIVFDGTEIADSLVYDDYLACHFSALGIDPKQRVVRLPQRARADFLAVLAACDLGLDTFGFSGGNTSLDAFSVGLPVVTLPGEFMRGRQTYAMLTLMSATLSSSLVAKDVDDYVKITTTLLNRSETREALKRDIGAAHHRLFDDASAVTALREWLIDNARQNVAQAPPAT